MSKFVFEFDEINEASDSVVMIYGLDELRDEFGICIEDEDNIHCYLGRVSNIGYEPTNVDINDLVRMLAVKTDFVMLAGGVTSREPRYEDWLNAIAGVVGSSITFATRNAGHAKHEYEVAFFSFPTFHAY